jgi:ankyrin repeat protein
MLDFSNPEACRRELAAELRLAAQGGQEDCVRLIHKLGADVNQLDAEGCSPVHVAANNGRKECVRVLHELGADANQCDPIQEAAPMHVAVEEGQEDGI